MTAGYAGDLTPQEAWDILASNPKAVLVDVRTEAEWNFVGVPDTSDLGRAPVFVEWTTYPDGQLNHRFVQDLLEAGVEPSADAPVIFLCRSGQRSIGAAVARRPRRASGRRTTFLRASRAHWTRTAVAASRAGVPPGFLGTSSTPPGTRSSTGRAEASLARRPARPR